MADQTSSMRFDTTEPYNVPNRKERSRELAQKRRTTYKSLMKDLADELPFSKDVISQVDYNSRLRLALCFFKTKMLAPKKEVSPHEEIKSDVSFHRGLLQELVTESLDGFIMVMSGDSSLIYISESIHKHLGLFQSEHIGLSIYELIHEDDHKAVKDALVKTESKLLSSNALGSINNKLSAECSFFCRMKCSRFKVSNTATKSPGYKLVFISGNYKIQGREASLFAIVRPVSPPSILELTMEGNMFVTHYNMEMKCIFFDGRLRNLMGYEKQDLINHVPFEFHHHDDVEANLECSKGLMEKGEGLSGYYRFLNKFGAFVWLQSRATMMFDSRTGKPSYIVCMNYVISREKGEESLELRKSSKEVTSIAESSRSHDPFPVPRNDGKLLNPFDPPEIVNSPMSITVDIDSSPNSVISSRSISPDSTELRSLESVSSSLTDKSNDSGYHHRLSHDSSSVIPTVVSPTPSFIDSAIGSPACDVFHSPPPLESREIKIESCSSPTTTLLSNPIGLNNTNTTVITQDTCRSGNAYINTQQHIPPHTYHSSHYQHHTLIPSPATTLTTTTKMLPFTQPTAYFTSSYLPLAGQEQHQYMTAGPGTPQLQTPFYTAQTEYSLPVNFTGRSPQFITHSVTGFVFHQPTPTASILPILNAEDVQFLDVAKMTPSVAKPLFHSNCT